MKADLILTSIDHSRPFVDIDSCVRAEGGSARSGLLAFARYSGRRRS
jgi:hypothetical protein